jgi:hypothetical protein
MNAPPPDDLRGKTYDSTMPTQESSEKDIAENAEQARRAVARHYPGEMGKAETDQGKATWKQLGIEKP